MRNHREFRCKSQDPRSAEREIRMPATGMGYTKIASQDRCMASERRMKSAHVHCADLSMVDSCQRYNRRVERVFGAVSLVLFVAAIIAFLTILRDVRPYLSLDDRARLGGVAPIVSWEESLRRNRAINTAWNLHSVQFPNSRKRYFFVALLLLACLSLLGYPLWLAATK